MEGFQEMVEEQFKEFQDQLFANLDRLDGGVQVKVHQRVVSQNLAVSKRIVALEHELDCWKKINSYLSQQVKNNNSSSSSKVDEDGGDEGHDAMQGSESTVSDLGEGAAAEKALQVLRIILMQTDGAKADAEMTNSLPYPESKPVCRETTGKQDKAGGDADPRGGSKRVLTRRRRTLKGGDLIDPFKYHDCLRCPKGFYKEAELRQHYSSKHALEFGSAPLPSSELELQSTQTDEQQTTRCFICHLKCASVEELIAHKSHHVDERFTRHRCDECGQRFVVLDELQAHLQTRPCRG